MVDPAQPTVYPDGCFLPPREVWLIRSTREIVPVTRIDGHGAGTPCTDILLGRRGSHE